MDYLKLLEFRFKGIKLGKIKIFMLSTTGKKND